MDVLIDMIIGYVEETCGEAHPVMFIFFKITVIVCALIYWYYTLTKENPDLNGADVLDLAYVVIFIGSQAILEMIKLCRLGYLDVENSRKRKKKKFSEAECRQKFQRDSEKWGGIIFICSIPIWSVFLIIFMGTYNGEV